MLEIGQAQDRFCLEARFPRECGLLLMTGGLHASSHDRIQRETKFRILVGKGGHIRPVPVPEGVRNEVNRLACRY